jgi:hypothetical protein
VHGHRQGKNSRAVNDQLPGGHVPWFFSPSASRGHSRFSDSARAGGGDPYPELEGARLATFRPLKSGIRIVTKYVLK